MTELEVAFVGAGGMATSHMESIDAFDGATVGAVCDIDEAAARAAARPRDATVYTDHEELLDAEEPDALFVATPGFARGEVEPLALERGIHLFVEKPVALDVETGEEIASLVDDADVITQVGYNYRYCDVTDEAVRLIGDRDVSLVDGHWVWDPGRKGWRATEATCGGVIPEMSTHVFDLARYFAGDVDRVAAAGGHRVDDSVDYDDTIAAVMHHESDAVSHVSTTLASPDRKVSVRLVGDGFRLDVAYRENTVTGVVDGEEIDYVGDGDAGDASTTEVHEFLAALREGDPERVRSRYRDGLATLAVCLGANEAASSGESVDLADHSTAASRNPRM